MFDYTDPQTAEAVTWLALFCLIGVAGAIGCVLHGLNREWRQYMRWRRTHAAWKAIVESDGK